MGTYYAVCQCHYHRICPLKKVYRYDKVLSDLMNWNISCRIGYYGETLLIKLFDYWIYGVFQSKRTWNVYTVKILSLHHRFEIIYRTLPHSIYTIKILKNIIFSEIIT